MPTTIAFDAAGSGRVFDGVGAISSSSSKLLHDYPPAQREELLDYLFRPDYGAALQILKVEIGADTNSTTTAEPSHMRTPDDLDAGRGLEWWMMAEAKKRNPDIRLAGLMWGAPAWIGRLWSTRHVDYVLAWLRCARDNGLRIDYVGGANESYTPPPQPEFFVRLKRALLAEFPHTLVVATDEHIPPNYWSAASDPAYSTGVDIFGEHDVCVWRSLYEHCHVSTDALNSGKPLWNSEQSSQDAIDAAEPLARALNRNYLDARLTANIAWAMTAGFYGNTSTGGTGLVATATPWSGFYEIPRSIWVNAHTAQFTRPGWRYLDGCCGYLPSGGSYVTLHDDRTGDASIVVETVDATATDALLVPPGLQLWSTSLSSDDSADWFVARGTASAEITVAPGSLYTLTTLTTGGKGTAISPADREQQLPLPFRENFRGTGMPRYFQDVQGAFESTGNVYRQAITEQPVRWHGGGRYPATIVGDPRWWGDYAASVDVRLAEAGSVAVIGRLEFYDPDALAGYHFIAGDSGWRLSTEDDSGRATPLADGDASLSVGKWHRLALEFLGDAITVHIDQTRLAEIRDHTHRRGQVGLAVHSYQRAEFARLAVTPTAPPPRVVPHRQLAVTASSEHRELFSHRAYPAAHAIDDRAESRWKTRFEPLDPLPQWIRLDLGEPSEVSGLTYTPTPGPTNTDDIITAYRVGISNDGRDYTTVAEGQWPATIATKLVDWQPTTARFVRLEALDSVGGRCAAATELNVIRA